MTISAKTVTPHHLLFSENPSLWQAVSKEVRQKIYHYHDRVTSHGDAASNLWLVLSGWIKLSRQTPDGKETVVGLCTDGDIFGEAALFPNASYPYSGEVLSHEAELLAIPSACIREHIKQDALLSSNIMAFLHAHTSQAQLKLEQMNTMTAAQRLGCFLLKLCQNQSDGAKTLRIPVEKNILAAFLGMKPETLSRTQQQLREVGVEVSGDKIHITHIERLQEFVCGSCSASGSCSAEAVSGI